MDYNINKIAICFYGLHPDETWKNVTKKKDKCFDLWTKNVFNINDCDIFMHSFSKKKDELLKYKPKDYLFEDEENSEINMNEIHNYEQQFNCKKSYNGWNISKVRGQYYVTYGIKRSIELMSKYEKKNNFKYDIVLLSRMDVCWLIPLELNQLNDNKIYSPIWGKNNIYSETGLLTYWLIGNSDMIKKVATLYDNMSNYLKENGSCRSYHRLLRQHVLTITNNIEYKYNDKFNDIIDMELQRYLEDKCIRF